MKTIRLLLLLMALVLVWPAAMSASEACVFVVPVESEINMQAARHLRAAMRQADEKGADILVLKMNTFGGALDAADSIRTALLHSSVPTVAFVDVNAASAGALIALACDSVYMAPGASIGSATVVNGNGEPMPEKYQSYMATMMRATAEHHGRVADGDSVRWRRNPDLAAAMVNPEVSLSLTAHQAVADGYAEGVAPDLDAVLADLQLSGADVVWYRSSLTDDILGFLANAGVRAVLVMLIVGGIYMEMKTPGLGLAGGVALVATILMFLPVLISGPVATWVLICLLAAVILIALEIFVVPGFGLTGISGIVLLVIAIFGMMTADGATIATVSAGRALIIILSGVVLAAALILYLTSSYAPAFVRRHSELLTELRNSEGFVGVDMEPARLVGKEAHTSTVLRPAGKIIIDGTTYDAVSTGAFIEPDKPVKVVKYENAQLYVEEV